LATTIFLSLPISTAAQEMERTGQGMMHADEATVRAVVEGFHAALAAGDSTSALTFLHPQVVVYEGGHAEDLQAYRSGHLEADMAFSQAVTTETIEDRLVLMPHSALYLRETTVHGTFRDRDIDARGVETMLVVPSDDGWKIRHIHWSSARRGAP
jgi:ketosteroid isomerase-like protein